MEKLGIGHIGMEVGLQRIILNHWQEGRSVEGLGPFAQKSQLVM